MYEEVRRFLGGDSDSDYDDYDIGNENLLGDDDDEKKRGNRNSNDDYYDYLDKSIPPVNEYNEFEYDRDSRKEDYEDDYRDSDNNNNKRNYERGKPHNRDYYDDYRQGGERDRNDYQYRDYYNDDYEDYKDYDRDRRGNVKDPKYLDALNQWLDYTN